MAGALSAWVVWLLGYPDTAIARMEETLALARRLSHGHTMAMTFQNFTMAHQFRGEADAVLAKAATQLALSQEQGFPLWIAGATTMRGWARAARRVGRGDRRFATRHHRLARHRCGARGSHHISACSGRRSARRDAPRPASR